MPRYDYRCSTCEMTFEADRPINQRDDVSCPDCSVQAERVWLGRAPGVSFKGDGWTRNESEFRSAIRGHQESVKNFERQNKEDAAKAWDRALDGARPMNDEDHKQAEAAISALEEKANAIRPV